MELHLQFGFGMMEHSKKLIAEWGGGTVILSPRDLSGKQLAALAKSISSLPGGKVLVDPQFYLPHADHIRLCEHEYWPKAYQTGVFFAGQQLSSLIQKLLELNIFLGSTEFILPGLLATEISDDWLSIQSLISEEANSVDSRIPLIQTIALSEEAIMRSDGIAKLLEWVGNNPIKQYYVVVEHANGNYLVDNPSWLANVLDLVAGMKIAGCKVILGYCNHQMLVGGCAKVDAIASGTWMNVRSFPPEKFKATVDEDIRQRATWFYCPQALSEFKIPFLDIAQKVGMLSLMEPSAELMSKDVAALFGGAQPTSLKFSEQASFRHYLTSLRWQCQSVEASSFDVAVDRHKYLLDTAEALLKQLSSSGVKGQMRDFGNIVEVNRAAIAALSSDRGVLLRRKWASL